MFLCPHTRTPLGVVSITLTVNALQWPSMHVLLHSDAFTSSQRQSVHYKTVAFGTSVHSFQARSTLYNITVKALNDTAKRVS